MAIIKKDGNFMGLPMNIARGNPIPLDKSEIWYSYEAMLDYAATDPVAYVGQILGLVDEANGSAKAYIILNTAGDVQEVGKATVVDNATIVLDEEKLSLKDFGKRYYRYVAEENNVAAHYELQEVDDEHPWKAGLEPKVVFTNDTYALGWYEPNPTTMEGVNAQIAGIQSTVDGLSVTTTNLSNQLKNVYTKTETNDEIAKAVSSAAHLKREIVTELPPVDEANENTIYMIASGLQEDDNKYYEYILLNGKFERVGSWEVDLKEYATKTEVSNSLTGINNSIAVLSDKIDAVDEKAEENYIKSVSENFNVTTEGQLQLVSVPTDVNLATNISLINKFLSKTEADSTYVSKTMLEELDLQAGAERNLIASLSEEFNVDENRHLTLVSVSGEKIMDIGKNADFSNLSTKVNSTVTDVTGLKSSLDSINSTLVTINNKFGDYVTTSKHNQDLADVWAHLTWEEL